MSSLTVKIIPAQQSESSRDDPVDPKQRNFLDDMVDLFAFPDQVHPENVRSGRAGLMQDARNIEKYFQKAFSEVA